MRKFKELKRLPSTANLTKAFNNNPSLKEISRIMWLHYRVIKDFTNLGEDSTNMNDERIQEVVEFWRSLTPDEIEESDRELCFLLDIVNDRWISFINTIDFSSGILGSMAKIEGAFARKCRRDPEVLTRLLFEVMFEGFIRDTQPEIYYVWKPREVMKLLGYKRSIMPSGYTELNIPDKSESPAEEDLDLLSVLLHTIAESDKSS